VVKLLIIGTSDNDGTFFEEPAWPWLVGTALSNALGEPVEVIHKKLYPQGAAPLAYLDRLLGEHDAELVALTTTTYPFSFRTVGYRLGDIFGHWAERFSHSGINGIDGAVQAEPGGSGGRGQRVADAARWLARRTIGTAGIISYEQAIGTYLGAVERLAQERSRTVLVVGASQLLDGVAHEVPKMNREIRKFEAELRGAALANGFGWVDQDAITFETANRPDDFVDFIHKGPRVHRRIAEEATRFYLSWLGRAEAGATSGP